MAQVRARVPTCVEGQRASDTALSSGVDAVWCLLPDGVHYGHAVIVDAYLSDQPFAVSSGGVAVTQFKARVVTCVAGSQPASPPLSTGIDPVGCLLPDGVHYGVPVIVDAYLSDQPIDQASGSGSGGGTAVNVTADIFVGAALVLCLALGWIAGGQR